MPGVQVPAQPAWPVGATLMPPFCVPCLHILPAALCTRLLGCLQISGGKAEPASRQELKVGEVSRRPELVDDFIRNFLVRMGLSKTLELFETEWYAQQPCCPVVCVFGAGHSKVFLRLSSSMQHKGVGRMGAVCSLGAPSAKCRAVPLSVACHPPSLRPACCCTAACSMGLPDSQCQAPAGSGLQVRAEGDGALEWAP